MMGIFRGKEPVFLLATLLSIQLCVQPAFAKQKWSVHIEPHQLINGSPAVFEVGSPIRLETLTGKWLDHEVFFALDRKTTKWYGLAGVSLETRAGEYPLHLDGITSTGGKVSFVRNVAVGQGSYPTVAVTVAKKFTEPDPEQIAKAAEDKKVKQETFSRTNPLREWAGSFAPPANAETSGVFGTQRTFNNQVQSTHQGLDFAVPEGTPVSAANSGTILVARPMFFEGNCIMIDHGQGLLTIYMHLSEFRVKEGDHVARGQLIGLSGGTGRATGPHLHFAVRWEGIYLDPATLLKLKLP